MTIRKKISLAVTFVLLIVLCAGICACNQTHQHVFNEVVSEQYLASPAMCTASAKYYKSCDCGEISSQTFIYGGLAEHSFTKQNTTSSYLCTRATCSSPATYYYSCAVCGKKGTQKFTYGKSKQHEFAVSTKLESLITPASEGNRAQYYGACKQCGLRSDETYFADVQADGKYTPTSPTISLYNTKPLTYGFTWNTQTQPITPVLSYKKVGDEQWINVEPTIKKYNSLDGVDYDNASGDAIVVYVAKCQVELQPNQQYVYKLSDFGTGDGTSEFTFTSCQPDTNAFSFLSISDSQDRAGGLSLQNALKNASAVDFYLHSGDICEDTRHEQHWTDMLDFNKQYLAVKPMMVATGNHDSVYKGDGLSTEMHFNNNIPSQQTNNGYFYSFEYGNAKFIVLNTNNVDAQNKLLKEQYDWLVEQLTNCDKTWKIVMMHNPIYSTGNYGSNPSSYAKTNALRAQLQKLFVDCNVDLVIQGHDHTVCKSYPIDGQGQVAMPQTTIIDGVTYAQSPNAPIYVVNGSTNSGGRNPYSGADFSLYEYYQKGNASSWAEYEIDGNKLTVTVKYLSSGNVGTYATWGIIK